MLDNEECKTILDGLDALLENLDARVTQGRAEAEHHTQFDYINELREEIFDVHLEKHGFIQRTDDAST